VAEILGLDGKRQENVTIGLAERQRHIHDALTEIGKENARCEIGAILVLSIDRKGRATTTMVGMHDNLLASLGAVSIFQADLLESTRGRRYFEDIPDAPAPTDSGDDHA